MSLDYLNEMPSFRLTPTRNPANFKLPEIVFYEDFLALLNSAQEGVFITRPNCVLGRILTASNVLFGYPIDQGMATTVISLIAWLGTDDGLLFRNNGKQERHFRPQDAADAYVVSWAIYNQRDKAGRRAIERCTQDAAGDYPELRLADYEAVEALMRWLGTEDGQQFLANTEAEISRLRQKETFEAYLRDKLNLNESQLFNVMNMAANYCAKRIPVKNLID